MKLSLIKIALTISMFTAQIALAYESWPVISISFDDGLKNTYDVAVPLMEERGMKGTLFVVPTWLGSWSEMMSAEEARNCQTNGWEIGSHSQDHTKISTLDANAARAQFADSKTWLENNGFDEVVNFRYPETATTLALDAIAAEYYYCRWGNDYAISQVWPETMFTPPVPSGLYEVVAYGWGNYVAELKQVIDQAVSDQKWICLSFHGVGEPSGSYSDPEFWCPQADFEEILDYIDNKELPVVPMKNVMDVGQSVVSRIQSTPGPMPPQSGTAISVERLLSSQTPTSLYDMTGRLIHSPSLPRQSRTQCISRAAYVYELDNRTGIIGHVK